MHKVTCTKIRPKWQTAKRINTVSGLTAQPSKLASIKASALWDSVCSCAQQFQINCFKTRSWWPTFAKFNTMPCFSGVGSIGLSLCESFWFSSVLWQLNHIKLPPSGPLSYLHGLALKTWTSYWKREGSAGIDTWNAPMVQSRQPLTYRLMESMGLGGPRWRGSSWQRGIAENGSSQLSTLMIETPGDLVWDLPSVQQASCLEGGPLLWIWPLYLHVNQKSDDDDDDDAQMDEAQYLVELLLYHCVRYLVMWDTSQIGTKSTEIREPIFRVFPRGIM